MAGDSATSEYTRLIAEETLFREAHAVLQDAMAEADISQKQIAHRLGLSAGRVSQIMSGSENLTLRSFAAVAWAIGLALTIDWHLTSVPQDLGQPAADLLDLTKHGRIEMPISTLPQIDTVFEQAPAAEQSALAA
jgi:transcriptional regulator with XRE-family HTH domain